MSVTRQTLTRATLDHVAVAVDDMPLALKWWHHLGATPVAGGSNGAFATEQVRLSNGGKVELIGCGPEDQTSFITSFLDRYGSGRIHHITLKVPAPLQDSIDRLTAGGLDVIDVSMADAHWHESFLRPSQVGGLIVQVAWASSNDAEFAVSQGRGLPPPVDPVAPAFRRVVLGHRDLDRAAWLWATLGAQIHRQHDWFIATFDGSAIAVEVRRADTNGPLGLVLDPHPAAERTPVTPALLAATR